MTKQKELTRKQRIEEEKSRLNELFEGLDKEEFRTVLGLIDQAAFLRITLEDLAADVEELGPVEEYTNGANQSGRKVSSALKAYNSTLRSYNATMRELMPYVSIAKRKAKIEPLKPIKVEPQETDEERTARINAEIAKAAAWQKEQWAKEKDAGNK